MIKHIVMIKFKPETSEEQIADIEKGLARLPGIIPEIKEYDLGRDVLHTDRSFDFALVGLYDDLAALKRYSDHPDHQAIAKVIRASAEKVVAVDFEC